MDKIICIGKNYIDHAKELGDAVPEKPVLFLKPPSALVTITTSGEAKLPRADHGSIHHECEIVLKLGRNHAIEAVTLGLDMTLRDLQTQLKKNGHPWEIAKAFPSSAIIGPWISIKDFPDYLNTEFSLSVQGQLRQKDTGRQMTFSPEQCIAHAAEYFDLLEGDLLFTGTPAGVGPVSPGDSGELRWGNRLDYRVRWGR